MSVTVGRRKPTKYSVKGVSRPRSYPGRQFVMHMPGGGSGHTTHQHHSPHLPPNTPLTCRRRPSQRVPSAQIQPGQGPGQAAAPPGPGIVLQGCLWWVCGGPGKKGVRRKKAQGRRERKGWTKDGPSGTQPTWAWGKAHNKMWHPFHELSATTIHQGAPSPPPPRYFYSPCLFPVGCCGTLGPPHVLPCRQSLLCLLLRCLAMLCCFLSPSSLTPPPSFSSVACSSVGCMESRV